MKELVKRWLGRTVEEHGEKGAEFYDRTFAADASWTLHYTSSGYYFLWTVILDRLRRAGSRRILEVACGTGQLASAIRDAGLVETYHGFDFSPVRLDQARVTCPELVFTVEDAFETSLFDELEYDCVIATEFLEHVDGDLEVLGRLKPGVRFIGTVPNFPYVSHVRHFTATAEVEDRYGATFESLSVVALRADELDKTFFLLEGIKR